MEQWLFQYLLATKKAGDGNRTHVSSLEGWCSTIELHPHRKNILLDKCPVPESNQRHEDFQSSALPTELTGQFLTAKLIIHKILPIVKRFFKKILIFNSIQAGFVIF